MTYRPFQPAWWLTGSHAQTIWGSLLAYAPRIHYRRERVDTPDGDFVDIDWIDGDASAPVVVLFHGLEGSSESRYARALMGALRARGWNGAVMNWRGCSGEPNRTLRAYHSGDTGEIGFALAHVRRRIQGPMYAAGVSLGGNALLKWLSEQGSDAQALVTRCASVCAPLDLAAGGRALEDGFNRLYGWHFLSTLRDKALMKAERFPHALKPESREALRSAKTLREFDNHYTAPVHGYRDTDDYWERASSKPGLREITVPTLVLNAWNDPFLPAAFLPQPNQVSAAVTLEYPPAGGHVGFVEGPFPGNIAWLPGRILHFFDHQT